MHNRIPSHMRATAIAVLLLLTSLIGSGLGPALVGMMSDHFAAFAFASTGVGFAQACPGGTAVTGAAASLQASCRTASIFGLR